MINVIRNFGKIEGRSCLLFVHIITFWSGDAPHMVVDHFSLDRQEIISLQPSSICFPLFCNMYPMSTKTKTSKTHKRHQRKEFARQRHQRKRHQDRDNKIKTNESERHVSCLQVQESVKFCHNTFRELFPKKYYEIRRMRDCM